VLPWCTYTSPEVAHVGRYEAEARAAGTPVDTLTLPLEDVDRAVLDGETEGFFRVHLRRGSDRILGATLVAEHAGEMISEIAVAMGNGVGLGGIGRTIHPYPTQAEIFRKAADARRRGRLTPAARRLFDLFFRVFR
jgi:pyruvate/2-oxoglutarate dehydrogenase complex dihydrolipoamide dehydrogenase (E3) component